MELIEAVLRQVRYREYLELEYGKEDAENRLDNLKELANLASRYDGLVGGEGLAMFLEDIALITDADRDAT
jgi:DNA helicase-2/ATP-dependent DNA helicase PcrA